MSACRLPVFVSHTCCVFAYLFLSMAFLSSSADPHSQVRKALLGTQILVEGPAPETRRLLTLQDDTASKFLRHLWTWINFQSLFFFFSFPHLFYITLILSMKKSLFLLSWHFPHNLLFSLTVCPFYLNWLCTCLSSLSLDTHSWCRLAFPEQCGTPSFLYPAPGDPLFGRTCWTVHKHEFSEFVCFISTD
jgi:hypothetical protein